MRGEIVLRNSLYLAWQYLRYHWVTAAVLIAAITSIIYLPAALQVIASNAQAHLRERTQTNSLLVGPKGSELELVLGSVYYDKPLDDVAALLAWLDQAHALMVRCLSELPEEALEQPIPTRWHGESAAHFFWIMVMHRVSHAAQIRTLRRAYGSRTHYYPIG